MSELYKNRGWGFWTTVAGVGLIVGYPLSIGPAAALVGFLGWRFGSSKIYNFVYQPIGYFDDHEPLIVGDIFARYISWCTGKYQEDWLSRLIVGAFIFAALIAFVVRIANKRFIRQASRPESRRPG